MPAILVIGYGNPLRGDDRLGWVVAERLARLPEIAGNPEVEIVTCHQLTPELAEPVSAARLVVFVDANATGGAGSCIWESVLPEAPGPNALGHHFTPSRVLAYARAIFGNVPRALVASVGVESFEAGEKLSPAVEAAIPELVEGIRVKILRVLISS